MIRSADRPADEAVRIRPVPSQCGQGLVDASSTPVRSRWRLISIRPKLEMRPTWMRARSFFSASFIAFSTFRTWLFCSMSMKSMTTRPAMSRRRSWRAISAAASRLVCEGGLLDIVLAGRPARVDVDRHQGLGRVDDQIAARLQLDDRLVHRRQLVLDAVALEQRRRFGV